MCVHCGSFPFFSGLRRGSTSDPSREPRQRGKMDWQAGAGSLTPLGAHIRFPRVDVLSEVELSGHQCLLGNFH